MANPRIYKHNFIPFNEAVSYFFSLPDSTLRLVEYNWEGSIEKKEELGRLFNANKELISTQIQDQYPQFKETDNGGDNWKGITDNWETDKCYIKQFIILGSGTYRVRLIIIWK
ncbi:hypothetical protein [Mucilaginibacter sp. UYP27]|uniref:hypothetical protein n=1 Tax=Mucilaginibacter sp. UYP27 TaxID=1756391 RepID=UPI003393A964